MLTDGVEIVRRLNKWLGREDIAQEDDAIEQLNKRFCILKLASEVVVADFEDEARIDFYKFDTFHKLLIKDTLPGKKKKDGSWSKERQLSDVWIRHKKGRKQGQLVYAPPGSPIKLKASDFNGWMGFAVKPTPGDWPLLERHLRDVLCGGDLELYFWVLNWCADLLQRPGAHGWTALVLQGGQGTGKGFFANDLLGRMFHPRHYSSPSRQAVFGDFPDVLSGKSLIFMDEATWGGDPKDNGKIKGFITGDKLSINRKNLSIAEEVSMLHFIFASNEDWPVGVERDDRRFAVLEVKNSQANSPAYFKPLYEELETIGRAAFLDFLLNHWTIDHDALRTPPASKKREELKRRSMKPVDEWWMYRLADGKLLPHHKGWETKVPVHELFLAYVAAMQNQGVNRRESPPQFSQHLVKISGATRMRNANKRELNFLSLDATREEFDRYLNTKTDWENV
jgi:hypothetical protein